MKIVIFFKIIHEISHKKFETCNNNNFYTMSESLANLFLSVDVETTISAVLILKYQLNKNGRKIFIRTDYIQTLTTRQTPRLAGNITKQTKKKIIVKLTDLLDEPLNIYRKK